MVAMATLMCKWRPLYNLRVATYGRHSDLDVQVATSTPFAHGRHLLDGEKDGFHGDLCI